MNLLFTGTGGRGGDSRGIEAWELEQGQREKDTERKTEGGGDRAETERTEGTLGRGQLTR